MAPATGPGPFTGHLAESAGLRVKGGRAVSGTARLWAESRAALSLRASGAGSGGAPIGRGLQVILAGRVAGFGAAGLPEGGAGWPRSWQPVSLKRHTDTKSQWEMERKHGISGVSRTSRSAGPAPGRA